MSGSSVTSPPPEARSTRCATGRAFSSACASPRSPPSVRRLTAAGLPAKAPHPREHRAVVLEPTEAGNTALDATRPVADRFDAEPRALLGPGGFARIAGVPRRPAFR
ncbi:MarR family winged helix-turn-helix transcriptional regulator [Streptomyces shenzhenensis]|uniref:Uncharacterized protein n=1 Tax=Streptomyces shenzhenensis TaxID=943815 RepID=A0A3M0IPD2_9ACTN|nr:MarR family winged helix-turn-helix transcriptional regulator [Streptomyces shenzhenensis]RMB83936.1 hypothetical protein CTZ28_20680 [Streptomyces shenzhenensis]